MRQAVILARVSTKDQEEVGYSLPAQSEKLREYAKRKGFEIIKEFSFSETAGPKIRRKFEQVLEFLRHQKVMPVLLCQNVDRITRNFRDAVDLDNMRLKEGLEIHFVQDGFSVSAQSSGNDMFQWEAKVFMAKQYINRLTDDAVRSLNYKIENGEWIAEAPLGYLNVADQQTGRRTVILDNERALLVKRLFVEYASGTISQGELTRMSKAWGLRNKKGSSLIVQTVSNILANPFYHGLMLVKGKLYPHVYPALIEPELFEACQRVKKAKAPTQAVRETKQDFILRGLVTCGVSGRQVTCDIKKGKYTYLIARDPADVTKKVWVKEEDVLDQLRTIIQSVAIPDDVLAAMLNHIRESHEAEKIFHHQRIGDLQRESVDLTAKLNRATDLLIDRRIAEDEYARKRQQFTERQVEIARLLATSHEADNQFKIALSGLISLASKAPELFASSTNAEKRALVGFMFSNLELKGLNIRFTLRKPFDALANLAGSQEWRALVDSNH